MQIKDALGEKISNWQALLMAHFSPNYTNQDRGLVHSTTFVNIFQPAETVIANIRKDRCIQNSFEYIAARKQDKPKCVEMMKNKEYEKLLDFLKGTTK